MSTSAAPGASDTDPTPGGAGTRSDLYGEPLSFEGRSLEGAPRSDRPKELARSLDGAALPVEDLRRIEPDRGEPARTSILRNSDGSPVSDAYQDVSDATVDIRNIQAQFNKTAGEWSGHSADSVWRGAGSRSEAMQQANARWSEYATARRTSPISFSDHPREIQYLAESETTRYSDTGEWVANLHRGADPPDTLDHSHATHYVPGPRGWKPEHGTGFGRFSQGGMKGRSRTARRF